jgi:ribonuclease J
MANGDFGPISIGKGDTVIISATPIPGNETSVYRIINQLFKEGAEVVYQARAQVHVSGHGSKDEIAQMVQATRPRDTLPFHGEHRMMALFKDLAAELGIGEERVTMAEVGDVIEITNESIRITDHVSLPPVYLDGGTVVREGDVVIRDRQALADDGIVLIVVAIDRQTGQIVAGPELVTRGFVHAGESAELLNATKERVSGVLKGFSTEHFSGDIGPISRQLRNNTQKFLEKETGRKPMVFPMVLVV